MNPLTTLNGEDVSRADTANESMVNDTMHHRSFLRMNDAVRGLHDDWFCRGRRRMCSLLRVCIEDVVDTRTYQAS